jgi:DNA primase large subunit
MEPRQLARFPFLKDSSLFIRENLVTLEELLKDSAYAAARALGKKRVLEAVEKAKVEDNPLDTEERRLQEILSYPMARILVSSVADGFLIRRYALAESKTMYDRLQTEGLDFATVVAGELGVEAELQDQEVLMHFADFLRYTTGIRSKEWKLVNTEVRAGRVSLSNTRFARVLEQAYHDRLEDDLPLEVAPWMLETLKTDIGELKAMAEQMKDKYKVESFGEVDVESFPPCIRRLIAMAQAGENLSHMGRFALTSFLFSIGLSREEILGIFAQSPDFDASKTKYQVDHITGEISGTTYTPPECSTMKSFGICFNPDDLCRVEWSKHPLIYYRTRCRRKRLQAPPKIQTAEVE